MIHGQLYAVLFLIAVIAARTFYLIKFGKK